MTNKQTYLSSEINPGIAKTVAKLQEWGYETCDSGDGATHDYECDRPYPYVVIKCQPLLLAYTCQWLKECLERYGIQLEQMGPDNEGQIVNIQGCWDACWDTAVIELTGLKDDMWLKE
jgi:hypothetical protein